MCACADPSPEWLDLGVPPSVLRPDLLLTTGQSFSWKRIGSRHWVGVLDSSVYEIRQSDETTLFRTIYGSCSRDRLWAYFDLDHEYSLDYSKLPRPARAIFESSRGVRILQQDPLECLISFICSANNNIGRITRMLHELKRSLGTFLLDAELNDQRLEFYAFPSFEQLCRVTPELLRRLGFGYRSEFVFRTVRILKSRGVEWLYGLRSADSASCRSALTSLPGVGRKVADCILLFGLGKREVVPVDVHVKRIAQTLLGLKAGKTLSDSEYRRIGQAFKSFAGDDAGWAQAVLFINSLSK